MIDLRGKILLSGGPLRSERLTPIRLITPGLTGLFFFIITQLMEIPLYINVMRLTVIVLAVVQNSSVWISGNVVFTLTKMSHFKNDKH